jgi:ANTAR domain
MWLIVRRQPPPSDPGGRPHPDPVGEVPVIDALRHLPDVGLDLGVPLRSVEDRTCPPSRDPTEQVAQLTAALASNRRIGMAMGIVVRQLDVDEDEAFNVLRKMSQDSNRKLRDVAEDIIRRRRL